MDRAILVRDEIDAGAEVVRRFAELTPVDAAFWFMPGDDPTWYLYVVSRDITDANRQEAYGRILPIARSLDSTYFEPFSIRVLGTDSPLAKAALEMLAKYPGRTPTRFAGPFGGLYAESGYLYPRTLPAPAAV